MPLLLSWSEGFFVTKKIKIDIFELFEEIKSLYSINSNIILHLSSEFDSIQDSKDGLIQILTNLVGNGIKYNDKEKIKIEIKFSSTPSHYIIEVIDNGIGMKSEHFNEIFKSFKNLNIKDRFGNYGTGMGLSTVKKIIDKMNATVEISSKLNYGTTFKICMKK